MHFFKIIRRVFFLLLLMSIVLFNTLSLAKEQPISAIAFDETQHIIKGKTIPNANIQLDYVMGSIIANDQGEFELPVSDDDIKRGEIRMTVIDALSSYETYEVVYDLKEDEIKMESDTDNNEDSHEIEEVPIYEDQAYDAMDDTEELQEIMPLTETVNDTSVSSGTYILIGVLSVIFILLVFAMSLFFFKKRKKAQHQRALEHQRNRKKRVQNIDHTSSSVNKQKRKSKNHLKQVNQITSSTSKKRKKPGGARPSQQRPKKRPPK